MPDPSKPGEPFLLQRYGLPNGLRVWRQPRPDSQSVAALLVVRAGSRYESLANNGVSHFVEDMLFAGTERWTGEEIKEIIRRRGGHWNGWTGPERTTYFAHVAPQDLDIALDWLGGLVTGGSDLLHSGAPLPGPTPAGDDRDQWRAGGGRRGWPGSERVDRMPNVASSQGTCCEDSRYLIAERSSSPVAQPYVEPSYPLPNRLDIGFYNHLYPAGALTDAQREHVDDYTLTR